ncbi:MAG: hypothetical protein ABL958_00130 [Bdellovibrionia bacterium]
MKMQRLVLIGAFVLSGGFLTGCETSEDDQINQAQACLDKSFDATSADACAAKVAGISGSRAAVIRCSASFIGQGFTTQSTKFLDAFNALKNKTAGTNSTISMIAYLSFTGSSLTEAQSLANQAVVNCNETGLDGMIMFANMAKLATDLKALTGIPPGSTPTPAQLQSQVANLSDEAAGEVAIAVADNYCRDSSTHDAEFCGQFNSATADENMTTSEIGALLKQHLADTSH